MWKIFRIDGPLFNKLSVIADLIIANLLFIVCSIPLVTMGASLAGLQRVCMDKAGGDDETVIKSFFKSFKTNFRQITISYFVFILLNVSILWYFAFVPQILTALQVKIVYIAAAMLMAIVNGIWVYLLPLIVRYDNKLSEHVKNAVLLSIAYIPKSITMIFLNIVPVALALISVDLFIKSFIFWILIGFALVRYVSCIIIKPVLDKIERTETDDNNTNP